MKCIVDNKKILAYLVDNRLTMKDFVKSKKISLEALNRALNKYPVRISTVAKLADAIGVDADNIIIKGVVGNGEGEKK